MMHSNSTINHVPPHLRSRMERQSIWEICPGYKHSVQAKVNTKPEYRNAFLEKIPAEITKRSELYGLTLSLRTKQWLEHQGGRYFQIVNKDAPAAKQFKESNLSAQDWNSRADTPYWVGNTTSHRFKSSNAAGSNLNCETRARQFYWFCAFFGDYDSMFLLLPDPPEECPSMNPDTIRAFQYHQYNLPGTPLFSDTTSTTKLTDINGEEILSEGNVLSHDTMAQKMVSLSTLHKRYNHGHAFQSRCSHCYRFVHDVAPTSTSSLRAYKIEMATHRKNFHPLSSRRFLNSGNAADSFTTHEVTSTISKTGKKRGYVSKKRECLYPFDMVGYHNHLIVSHYEESTLRHYTMILQSIHTGCRFEGYWSTSIGNLNYYTTRLCPIVDVHDGVQKIAMKLIEKTDSEPHVFQFFFQDYFPRLCFVRHLLVYVHCYRCMPEGFMESYRDYIRHSNPSQWNTYNQQKFDEWCKKPLYDFPSVRDSNHNDPRMHAYRQFDKYVLDVFKAHCQKSADDELNIGVHSFRHTFYVFARLGGATMEEAMRVARHLNRAMAEQYQGDIDAIMNLINQTKGLREQLAVFPFEDNMYDNDGHQLKHVLHSSLEGPLQATVQIGSIEESAMFFVKNMLHISPNHPQYRNPKFLLEKSYTLKFDRRNTTDISTEQRLRNGINEVEMNDASKIKLQGLVDNFVKDVSENGESATTSSSGGARSTTTPIPSVNIFHKDRILQLIRSEVDSVVSDLKLIEYDFVVGKSGIPKVKFTKALKEFITSKDPSSDRSVFHSIVALRLVHEIASLGAFHVSKDAKSQRDNGYDKASYSFDCGLKTFLPRVRNNRTYHKPLIKFHSCLQSCYKNDYKQFSNANKHFRIRTLNEYQKIKKEELCKKCNTCIT